MHFASNEDAGRRLIKLGEIPENVFNVGCPSIDAILETEDDSDILKRFGLKEKLFYLFTTQLHPRFKMQESRLKITLSSIKKSNENALIILPNNDAGFSEIIEELKDQKLGFVESLKISEYINLLKRSSGLIGNSSSSIHETSTFNIPYN